MANYLIVLFKNNERKKIIHEFMTLERAQAYFENHINTSNQIIFNKEVVGGLKTKFELGLVQVGKSPEISTYLKDDLGRNIKIKLEEENMSLLKISTLRVEELIYDYQKKKKISINEFLKNYINKSGMKLISGLNNKVVVQNEDNTSIFVLKNQSDCDRFLDILSVYFFNNKKFDCIVVKDNSTIQRKYLYDLLEANGFDRKFLYRQSTLGPQLE